MKFDSFMSNLLAQTIVSASDDAEKWMNVMFVVVLALFWLVGGIAKARANKRGAQIEQSPHKPVRKPPLHSAEAREQMLSRLQRPAGSVQSRQQQPSPAARKPRMKLADLQAAVRRLAVEAEQADQVKTGNFDPELEEILTEPKIKIEKAELTEPMNKIATGLQGTKHSEAAQTSESEYLSELLLDYSDPEDLRRAILHYETLGKPLSLRDSFEDGIGL
jgi:hypothetical protein